MARKPTLRKIIGDLIKSYDPVFQAAFLDSISEVKSQITLKILADRLERGDVEGALDALNLERAAFAKLENAIATAYVAGGSAMTGNMPTLRGANGGRILVRFDVRNLRAEQWLREHSALSVAQIIDDQRDSIRSVLVSGMTQGRNPNSVALDIAGRINPLTKAREGGLIGLTKAQAQYVNSARQELASGDPALMRNYLTRARRDKRFDRTVVKAIADGGTLDKQTINRITGRYSDGLLKLRAQTIARTEALSSIHAGKKEGFTQGLAKTNYPPEAVTRVWRSAGDSRTRHTHSAMNGQEVKGLEAPFQSPNGAQLMHPGDTSLGAGADEVINCRCDLDYRIEFGFGLT